MELRQDIMKIPASRWYQVIEKRRSSRGFEPRSLDSEAINKIKAVCRKFKPFPNVRAELVTEAPDTVFKGAIGPYGKVKGASAFISFIGNMERANVQEQIGYIGEGIILEPTALNLDTCWVAGFFRRRVVELLVRTSKNERIIAVTPIGYAKNRRSLE